MHLGHGHRHRFVHRDDTERQDKRGHSRQQQHDTVHAMERLATKQQAIEHVEHGDEHRHLRVVYQKVNHSLFV